MNTKPIPACLALLAGFVTCVISFVQHVDTVVFAKRFVVVCIIFFVIGTAATVIINMNFKEMAADGETDSPEGADSSEANTEGQADSELIEETKQS